LAKEKVLVVGLGEIGHALFDLLKEEDRFIVYGLDLDETKMRATGQNRSKLQNEVDTMHVCLLCKIQEKFVDTVASYAKQFKPKLLIINSTVPPGTTKKTVQLPCCPLSGSWSTQKLQVHEVGVETLGKIRWRSKHKSNGCRPQAF
jgi:UDP-N-acetyl-D-mannosaminuronate dehydrogenase